jgi:hypothetical protein
MTIRQLLKSYSIGETDAVSAIRMLSGVIDPEKTIAHLAVICQITRVEHGDLEMTTFKEMYFLEN